MDDLSGPAPGGTLYERAGGWDVFSALVSRFYEGVATDDRLRPLYPEADLDGAVERLTLFLVQYAGGPRGYEELRGAPKLRLRHLEFPIGDAEVGAWLGHMAAAVTGVVESEEVAGELLSYFEKTAAFLVNRGGPVLGPAGPTTAGR